MSWDKEVFKHLWIWAVYRGSYEFPWYGRTYNIALEPWSSLPDNFDKALKNKECISLRPAEKITSKYCAIVYQSKKRINGFDSDLNVIL